MVDHLERQEHAFLVRLWREPSTLAPSQWRGMVEHLPSGNRRYFTALVDLVEFIATRRETESTESEPR